MRASLGFRAGPLYVGTGNLLKSNRRRPRRRGPNAWTWLVLFPLVLMWFTVKFMYLGIAWLCATAWRAVANR
jgi:hypothetical protein